jgi:3-dehydroquinate synthase
MEKAIYRCAVLHLEHIGQNGDPFEFGSARPLDFGHWAAHKIESMSGYRIGHGQAVSIGICIDSWIASALGLIQRDEFNRITESLSACGMPVWDSIASRCSNGKLELIEGVEAFREHLGGKLTLTMPQGIGRKVEIHHIENRLIEDAVTFFERSKGISSI